MKHSFFLLLIFMLAFSSLLCYALWDRSPKIYGDFEFRKLNVERLCEEYPEPVDSVFAEETEVVEEVIDTIAVKDTMHQSILLFGDSMTAPLSYRIRDYASANGHTLTTVCWYSSTTGTWAETDTLQHFLNTVNPTFIFICLGSNQLFVKDLDKVDRNIKTILEKIGGIPVIWIGPPNWKPDTGINEKLLENMGEKAYYPSLNLKLKRSSDGMHPTNSACAGWFDSVAVWMNNGNSARSIRLDPPQEKGKQKLILLQPYSL